MELAGKRVLVTGGAGFVGSHFVDALVAADAEVVVLDNLSVGTRRNVAAAEEAGARLAVGDVCDAGVLDRELASVDVVVHMACSNLRASLRDPVHTHEINAKGTLLTLLAAVKHEVSRFVYVSSSEAYGSGRTVPMREDHPLEPTTVYGASKAAGELYALGCMRTYGLPVSVVRPFNAYGPRGHVVGTSAEVIPKFVARMLAGNPPVVFGEGSQTRDFTWVEETAAGIVAAVASDELVGGAINIAFGRGVSILEIARILVDLLGEPGMTPVFDAPRPGDVGQHCADVTKARELLGFEARVPIEEGLARYLAWVQRESARVMEAAPVRNW